MEGWKARTNRGTHGLCLYLCICLITSQSDRMTRRLPAVQIFAVCSQCKPSIHQRGISLSLSLSLSHSQQSRSCSSPQPPRFRLTPPTPSLPSGPAFVSGWDGHTPCWLSLRVKRVEGFKVIETIRDMIVRGTDGKGLAPFSMGLESSPPPPTPPLSYLSNLPPPTTVSSGTLSLTAVACGTEERPVPGWWTRISAVRSCCLLLLERGREEKESEGGRGSLRVRGRRKQTDM